MPLEQHFGSIKNLSEFRSHFREPKHFSTIKSAMERFTEPQMPIKNHFTFAKKLHHIFVFVHNFHALDFHTRELAEATVHRV